MRKGIIYLMTTSIDGVIKIGKTDINNFESRMYNLERNGYFNVNCLKREFAIEVDNYSDKEALLDRIFNKSQIGNSELFAIDIDLAKQLLSAFEGKVIYPKENKNDIFIKATDAVKEKEELELNRHHFKGAKFYSSLTNKEYYTKTNDKGTLSVYEIATGLEVPNNSRPSKKQILLQACKDLNIIVANDNTLYQLAHKIEKTINNV